MILRAGRHQFTFPGPALVMGVLNVTPDSFSDGGRFLDVSAAVDHAFRMESEGAAFIDVGGESTRPGASPVGAAEELRRVLPVLTRLADRVKVPLSIDTRKPEVAAAALDAGASLVNDVGACCSNEAMAGLVAKTGAGYVIMHMQGDPETMQAAPAYDDVVRSVEIFFTERIQRMRTIGVNEEQLVLDVGIGFGKTLEHNLRLLSRTSQFIRLGRPVMLGVSRKSFMASLLGLDVMRRLPASLACAVWAAQAGASIIRTHDVWETKAAIRMAEAIMNANPSGRPDGAKIENEE